MINEKLAEEAKRMNSFSDYEKGSATNEYNDYCNKFIYKVEVLKQQNKERLTPENEEKINYFVDRYKSKLAEAINEYNRIESYCPSVMICGPANFPVRKKEKQNNMRDNWRSRYSGIYSDNNYYFNKIVAILTNKVIYSNDDFIIEKLQDKINELEEAQTIMKNVNAYYRKNKTLEDCEYLTENQIKALNKFLQDYSYYDCPFPSYKLTNNNSEIRRLKDRLSNIQKLKERAENNAENKYIKVDGVEVVEDATDMRIRIIFNEIPDSETRNLLKSNGFKWSPKNSAWQRQLTTNGIYATKRVLEILNQE